MNYNFFESNGVGVEHVGGDMFDSVPSGDAIFMKVSLCDKASSFCHSFIDLLCCSNQITISQML